MEAVRSNLRNAFEAAKPYLKVGVAVIVGLVALAAIVNGSLALHDPLSPFNWAGKAGSIAMTALGGAVVLGILGFTIYLILKNDKERVLTHAEILALAKRLPPGKAFVCLPKDMAKGKGFPAVVYHQPQPGLGMHYYCYNNNKAMEPWFSFNSLSIEGGLSGSRLNHEPFSSWADKMLSIDDLSKMPVIRP